LPAQYLPRVSPSKPARIRGDLSLKRDTIVVIGKYPPIEGGVSAHNYWFAQALAELGHNVIVLTNADEVEPKYRLHLTLADHAKLRGFRVSGRISVISTQPDTQISYVPGANPYLTKLSSLGIAIVRKHRPRFLFTSYLEPYGVAALLISKLTGVPYVFQHAGSDIGRLINSPQLRTVYCDVLCNAAAVITAPYLHRHILAFGVNPSRLVKAVYCRLPRDLFFPTRLVRRKGDELRLISYGKVGTQKGTIELLDAVKQCRTKRMKVKLVTHWGGDGVDQIRSEVSRRRMAHIVLLRGFIPHWRVAGALRQAHVGVYLENRFEIPLHTPIGLLECWASGRPAIISEDILAKGYIATSAKLGVNCFLARGSPPSPKNIGSAIEQAYECVVSRPQPIFVPSEALFPQHIHDNVRRMLSEIRMLLSPGF
jgi:glycosyltransferase involved in cell wall biosynthesis